MILDTSSYEHDLKDFSFTFIELPKFNKQEHELETIEEKWIYFLRHADKVIEIPRIFQGTPIEEAYHTLERYTWSEAEILAYEDAALAVVDVENTLEVTHQKGKIEGKIEVARNFLKDGISVEVIARNTGLSLEEIRSLK